MLNFDDDDDEVGKSDSKWGGHVSCQTVMLPEKNDARITKNSMLDQNMFDSTNIIIRD